MTNDCRSCICLFASLYHPSIGGVETYTASLAHELACRGLRVIVVACNTHGQPSREEELDGIEVLRLPCLPLLNTRFPCRFSHALQENGSGSAPNGSIMWWSTRASTPTRSWRCGSHAREALRRSSSSTVPPTSH